MLCSTRCCWCGCMPGQRAGFAVQEVLWVMRARLAQIEERWVDGRLRRGGLDADEVCHLVCALFEDTELRREVLAKVCKA